MPILSRLTHLLRRDAFLMQFVPAAVVFLVLMVFALASWQNAKRSLDAEHEKAVDQQISYIEDKLGERMQMSGTLLRAGNGLIHGSIDVTGDEWDRFYKQLTLVSVSQGIDMVGYAPIVTAEQIPEIEAVFTQNGTPATIAVNEGQNTYVPILYAARFGTKSSVPLGKDLYIQDEYKAAIDAAIDTNKPRLSDAGTFDSSKTKYVFLYMPVLGDGAPVGSAPKGLVFESIDINTLFSGLLKKDTESFGFSVSEKESDHLKPELLYASKTAKELHSQNVKPVAYSVVGEYGREWQIRYYARSNIVTSGERSRPMNVLLAGIGLALVASALVYLLIKYRTRMFALAEEQKLQRAKDELLSLASHQLRTPATGVKQYVGMVLDGFGGPVPDDQAKLLEQAYKSNERQLQIINDFLYVAKLGSGSLTTTKHKFDIAPLVRDVVEEMSLDIKDKHHKIHVKTPKSLMIKADEHSVRMIIENLLSNAVKYTQPGGKIDVSLVQGNREILVSIKDNGVGMSRKEQRLLFKQFSRIPNELTNEVSGSGIGLYLAQQLAVRNGGKITVESEQQQGSTFTLCLPNWRVKKITVPRRNT